jgi:O-acetylhomoserine (thiol)-lyase
MCAAPSKIHPATVGLHGGWRFDPETNAAAVPIYQTTSYEFNDAQHAADLFALSKPGNIYTRIMNPTNDVLEKRVAELEGGAASLAVASGQAASAFAILTVASAGDNIVASTDIYGGTWNLFSNTLKQLGVETRFVDPKDPQLFRKYVDDKTRAFYAETLPNPKLHVFPLRDVANIADEVGVPLIVDNTACPVICRPIDHGAHIVVYSATKYLGGHGTTVSGLVVDSGKFPWDKHADRFPLLTRPDPSYHGAVWTEAAGSLAYITRCRVNILRDVGAALSPFSAFLILTGVETVTLRMKEHSANALKVAQFLERHPKVASVSYPGLQTGETRKRADAYFSGGYGGLVGFELKAGVEAGKQFINSLKLFYHVANIGDARSLAIHPASTTHSQLSPEDQLATGTTPGYVRLSVGIEYADDIIADIRQALDKTGAAEDGKKSKCCDML